MDGIFLRTMTCLFLCVVLQAGDEKPANTAISGHNLFFDILHDHKDLAPTPRIAAMLIKDCASLHEGKGSGVTFVNEKLPSFFQEQVRKHRAIQPTSKYRVADAKGFPFYLDDENIDHVTKRFREKFPTATNDIPKEKILAAFTKIEDKKKCFGILIAFYGPEQNNGVTDIMIVIFNDAGQIVLIDLL